MEHFEHNKPEITSGGYTPEIDLKPEETPVEEATETPIQDEPLSYEEEAPAPEDPEDCTEEAPEEDFPIDEEHVFEDYLPKETKWQKLWREKKLFVILASIFSVIAIALIAVGLYVHLVISPFAAYDKIMPNVYCAGINIGGMTKSEAQSAIEEALRYPEYSLTVTLPDAEYTFQPQQEGITLNGAEVAKKAYQYGRGDTTAYGMYKSYHACMETEYRLDAETDLAYNSDDILRVVTTIYDETYIAPTDTTPKFDKENHIASLVLGQPGREIHKENLYKAVCQRFDDMNFTDMTWEYQKVEIDTSDFRALCRECVAELEYDPVDPVITADAENHTIIVEMGQIGYDLDSSKLYKLALEAVQAANYGEITLALDEVEPETVNIIPAYQELACDPVEPFYYYGEILGGTNGYTIDWDKAVADILATPYGETVIVAMDPIPPNKTADEVRAVLFRDTLAYYSSPHEANSNRTNNLVLACKAINGTVLNAGDTFSFNNVVGERTAAKGYKEATVYVGNDSVGELGGGICQVASTMYCAALYAQMEIVSRDCHNFMVTYVPGGLDATVYWGSLDFAFKNSTEYPVRIWAWVENGQVHISLEGTNVDGSYVKLSSTQLSSTPFSVKYKDDPTKPVGYEKVEVTAYTGYKYEAYQYIYNADGSLRDTVYLGTSTYQKRDRVVIRGTKEEEKKEEPKEDADKDSGESSGGESGESSGGDSE